MASEEKPANLTLLRKNLNALCCEIWLKLKALQDCTVQFLT